MQTPDLIHVLRSGASKRSRLTAFNREHNIVTHLAKCVANVCRLMDEMGIIVTGEGELSAIRLLCEQNGIVLDI